MDRQHLDCDDEDIILQNSPLGQYLQEVSPENFTEENCGLFECEQPEINADSSRKRSFFASGIKIFNYFKECVHSLFDMLIPQLTSKSISGDIFVIVSNHKLLEPEDKEFLSNLQPDACKLSSRSYINLVFQWSKLPVLVLTLAYCAEELIFFEPHTMILYVCGCFFYFLAIIGTSVFTWHVVKCTYAIFNEAVLCHRILHLSDCLQGLNSLIKKCIRLLQEAELVARGFTSTSVTGVAQRLELSSNLPIFSSNRQYPELRQFMFKMLRDMFFMFREETKRLLNLVNNHPELSFASHCIATLDLREFGDLLIFDVESKELMEISDGLSIASLKTVYYLMALQISEFFKCLCLSYIYGSEQKGYGLNNIIKNSDDALQHVKAIVNYYKNVNYCYHGVREKPNSENSKLKVSVNNVCLHLKASLSKLIQIEDELDKNDLQKLHQLYLEAKSELESCNDSFNECGKEFEILLNVDGVSIEKISPNDVKLGPNEPTNVVECNKEPIIEDEVFEALVTDSKPDGNEFPMIVDPDINPEVTSSLMHELKNILVVKADEWHVREQKARKKLGLEIPICEGSADLLINDEKLSKCLDVPDYDRKITEMSEKLSEVESKLLGDDKPTKDYTMDQHLVIETSNKEEMTFSTKTEMFPDKMYIQKLDSARNSVNQGISVSVAALAAQRQKMLGISSEVAFEVDCFEDIEDEHLSFDEN